MSNRVASSGAIRPLILNPSIVCSPPVADRFTLYFGDRNSTASVHVQEWNQLTSHVGQGSGIDDLYASCLPYLDKERYPNQEAYLNWLKSSGIVIENPSDTGQAAEYTHRRARDPATQKKPSGGFGKIYLFDLGAILDSLDEYPEHWSPFSSHYGPFFLFYFLHVYTISI
jgi:hypothetical protein